MISGHYTTSTSQGGKKDGILRETFETGALLAATTCRYLVQCRRVVLAVTDSQSLQQPVVPS